jgi:protein-S-isoprenylcysteine O-methyltransferase Ste14
MLAGLQTIAWVACVIYATIPSFWLVIHPRVDYWRKRRSPYLILVPAWIGMWILLGGLTAPWRRAALYATFWSWIPAGILLATGLWIYLHSGKHFSRAQLGGFPELIAEHREQRLVTVGIRARVRHPVYLAHLCEMLAWSVGTGLILCYGLTAFALLTGAVMIRMEDQELQRRFGADYAAYRNRVPTLLPRLRV